MNMILNSTNHQSLHFVFTGNPPDKCPEPFFFMLGDPNLNTSWCKFCGAPVKMTTFTCLRCGRTIAKVSLLKVLIGIILLTIVAGAAKLIGFLTFQIHLMTMGEPKAIEGERSIGGKIRAKT